MWFLLACFRTVRTFLVAVAVFLCLRSFFSLWEVIGDGRSRLRHSQGAGSWRDGGDLGVAEAIKKSRISNITGQIIKTNDTFHRDTSCQSLKKPDPDGVQYRRTWQIYRANAVEVMTYSAFFDDRPAVGLLPSIRMMVVSHMPKNTEFYCHVWYADLSHPYVTKLAVTKTGRGDVINKIKYEQSLFSCALPSSYPVPSHVSLSTVPCKPSSIYLPVIHSVRTSWEHEFGICVAIAFGSVDTAEFVEWMEFHRLLGVTEFNIYDGDISGDMDEVFQYYTRLGWLRVHKMPPAVDEISYGAVKLSSPASLNDCMLRNVYRYRYMIVIDFDEFIVPKVKLNYHDLLEEINKENKLSEPWMSYTFRNTYFLKDFEIDTAQPENAHTLRFRHRARPSRAFYAAKSFIDPRRCFSVFNHYCYIRFPKSDKKFSIDVRPDLAACHHYRKCNIKDCDTLKKEDTLDDIMLSYKDKLVTRINTALDKMHKP